MEKQKPKFEITCYDPVSDKILGTKEGTLSWWHEAGHREQRNSGTLAQISMISSWAQLFCLMFLFLDEKMLAGGALLIICCNELYLEADAWVYAFRNYKREIREMRK